MPLEPGRSASRSCARRGSPPRPFRFRVPHRPRSYTPRSACTDRALPGSPKQHAHRPACARSIPALDPTRLGRTLRCRVCVRRVRSRSSPTERPPPAQARSSGWTRRGRHARSVRTRRCREWWGGGVTPRTRATRRDRQPTRSLRRATTETRTRAEQSRGGRRRPDRHGPSCTRMRNACWRTRLRSGPRRQAPLRCPARPRTTLQAGDSSAHGLPESHRSRCPPVVRVRTDAASRASDTCRAARPPAAPSICRPRPRAAGPQPHGRAARHCRSTPPIPGRTSRGRQRRARTAASPPASASCRTTPPTRALSNAGLSA